MMEWVQKRLRKKRSPGAILEELFEGELAEDEEGFFGTDNMSAILIIFRP